MFQVFYTTQRVGSFIETHIMILMIIFVLIGFAFIGWSFYENMKSKKRTNKIAYPRQIAMYLSRILTDESLTRIGLEFGGRDHSTIMHSCDKIAESLKDNNQVKDIIKELKKMLST